MSNAYASVFPVVVPMPPYQEVVFGLTKRELFAAMVMAGDHADGGISQPRKAAARWVASADALLAELNKPQTTGEPQ